MAEITARTTIHNGPRFDLEQLTVRDEHGRSFMRDVVRHPGAVVVLPVLDDGRYVLIRNHRVAVEQTLWELCAGMREPNEEAIITAQRELVEECGYEAQTMTPLASFYTTPGMTDELMHAFVATGLHEVGQQLEAGEQIELALMTPTEVRTMIRSGELMDAKSLLTILLHEQTQGSNSSNRA